MRVNFGWKCRKSIRWSAIHVEPSDRELLREAGDQLVDGKTIPYKSLSRLYEIRFKAAHWNPKTKDFSREPKISDKWLQVQHKLVLASEHDNYLAEQIHDFAPHFASSNYDVTNLQNLWISNLLLELFSDQSGRVASLEEAFLSDKVDDDRFSELFCLILEDWFIEFGVRVETTTIGDESRPSNLVGKLLKACGLPSFVTRSVLPTVQQRSKHSIKVKYSVLESSKFCVSSHEDGFEVVYLNLGHPFIESIAECGMEANFSLFIRSMFKALSGLNFDEDQQDDLISLLSLELKRDVS